MTGATTTLNPGTGNDLEVTGTLADDSANSMPSGGTYGAGTGAGAALVIAGGTVGLDGANTYAGDTTSNT